MADSNSFRILIDIFASPGEAFAAIRERPKFVLPWLLVMLASAGAIGLYMSEVDIGWLTEQSLRSVRIVELTEDQIEQMVEVAVDRGPGVAIVRGALTSMAAVTIFFLLQALYLKVVSAIAKDGVRYRQWFGLSCWTAMPAIVGSIATIVFILTNDVSFISQTGINPLSFSSLLGIDVADMGLMPRVLLSTSPVNLWTIALMIFGYRTFTQKSLAVSASVVLGPPVVLAAAGYALT